MASRMRRSTSWRSRPVAMQPGTSGEYAAQLLWQYPNRLWGESYSHRIAMLQCGYKNGLLG
jgi:hypothetical protein